MGYELWTSSRTGYRRRGTRLAELRELFETGITAEAILEPVKSCPLHADAMEMAAQLEKLGFDRAGVRAGEDEPVIGYVEREELRGGTTVADHVRELGPSVLIADSTPLVEIFSTLSASPFTFVMVGSEVRGILTQADLNKPPVRIYLFGLLSQFEMHVTVWIRRQLQDDWETKLSRRRLRSARHLQERKKAQGHDTSLIDCLTLQDKGDVLAKAPAVLEYLGIEVGELERFEAIQDLRNRLAHSHHNLAEGRQWVDLNGDIAWVEEVVERSDAELESLAAAQASDYADGLFQSI